MNPLPDDDASPAQEGPEPTEPHYVDARGGMGIVAGEGNIQINNYVNNVVPYYGLKGSLFPRNFV